MTKSCDLGDLNSRSAPAPALRPSLRPGVADQVAGENFPQLADGCLLLFTQVALILREETWGGGPGGVLFLPSRKATGCIRSALHTCARV